MYRKKLLSFVKSNDYLEIFFNLKYHYTQKNENTETVSPVPMHLQTPIDG